MRQFSAALAHELRTPVAILRGEAELALRPSSSDEDLRQVLMRQIDEFDRLTRLINQILTLARAEGGEIKMADQPVDLVALSASVAEQIEPVAAVQGITLTCEAADGVMVKGDAGWLERLLLILLDNAIKFTPEGGRISVTFSCAKGLAHVAVTDTGMGISPDALPHLFERFYRADPARSRQMQGAGLGLALAKWIAERHRGTIDVKSQPGEGSTFTVSLPALQARGNEPDRAHQPAMITASPARLTLNRVAMSMNKGARCSSALAMPGSQLTGFLALHASNGERKGPEPRFRDVSSALDTLPVVAGFQPSQRGIDPLDRFILDLNERQLDVLLNVDIGHFPFVESADGGRSSPL